MPLKYGLEWFKVTDNGTNLIDHNKGQETCYSAAYMSHTRDQQRLTISEVAADWHEPMVPQRIMWPSIARANVQYRPRAIVTMKTNRKPYPSFRTVPV